MKLKNYKNFINESNDLEDSEERVAYKNILYSFFESKGIPMYEHNNGNGNAEAEIYYYGPEDPNMYVSIRYDNDDIDVSSKEFYENYTKNYPIYLSIIEIVKEFSFDYEKEKNSDCYVGYVFKINHEDLKNTTNNELRSLLGLSKYKL